MTWPVTLTNLTNTDSPSDNPSLARADILQTMQNINEIINNGVPLLKTDSQLQLATAATTTGTPPAYQATLIPAPASLTTGLRLRVKFHTAGAGVDTLNVNALGSVGLRQYDNTGAKVPAVLAAGQLADVEYDGLDWVVLDPLPAAVPPAVPSGTVIWVAASTSPAGYLKANGAVISRTTFSELFSAIGTTFGVGDGSTTFGLPDLRGEFLRGWDDGRGVDAGRVLGGWQADDFESHFHDVTGWSGSNSLSGPVPVVKGQSQEGVLINIIAAAQNTGGSETRPRNVALLACIKY